MIFIQNLILCAFENHIFFVLFDKQHLKRTEFCAESDHLLFWNKGNLQMSETTEITPVTTTITTTSTNSKICLLLKSIYTTVFLLLEPTFFLTE